MKLAAPADLAMTEVQQKIEFTAASEIEVRLAALAEV
jgi:hypothetical protein